MAWSMDQYSSLDGYTPGIAIERVAGAERILGGL
jgi:hypothetical protein